MDDDERPSGRTRDRGVIDTDELDISRDERVAQIESGRYVITTGNSPPRPEIGTNEDDADESGDGGHADSDEDGGAGDGDANRAGTDDDTGDETASERREIVLPRDPRKRAIIARRLLTERVGAIQADHAVVATALVDGTVEKHESVSNDVTEVFHSLVTWYADAVGSGQTPTDEVLGILLLASEVQVTYPGRAVAALAAAHGLGRDDSIGQLLDAVEETGASFPPRRK